MNATIYCSLIKKLCISSVSTLLEILNLLINSTNKQHPENNPITPFRPVNYYIMSSNETKSKETKGTESSFDSNSVSSKPGGDEKQPSSKGSDTLITTNDPASSSTTATESGGARKPAAQSEVLPSPSASVPAAAAAARTVPRCEKKKKKPRRRAGFKERFIQKVKIII